MRLTAPDQSKTVTVSDGTVATVRRPRGGDVVRAQEIAVGDNKFSSPARCWSSLLASSGFFARQATEQTRENDRKGSLSGTGFQPERKNHTSEARPRA